MHDPDVLILDEPTDGLDPDQKYEMRDLIRTIAPQKAIIISTHILEEVEAVCTRAIIIAKGRMLADATPAELLARAPVNGSSSPSRSRPPIRSRRSRSFRNQPGIGQVEVAERVNGVTRLLVHARAEPRPRRASSPALLGRADIAADRDST